MSKPLVVVTFCLRRLPSLSAEAFYAYWKNDHGPLVKQHLKAMQAVRYAQLHTLPTPLNEKLSRGGPPTFDGYAQVYFESMDDLVSGMTTDEGKEAGRALIRDERKFIDFTQSTISIGEEHVFYDART